MFKLNIPFAPLVRVLVLAAFLVTAVQNSAFAAGKSFVVHNNTNLDISVIYYAPDGGKWKVVGGPGPGSSVGIPVNTNVRIWHFNVVFSSGEEFGFSADVIKKNYITIP